MSRIRNQFMHCIFCLGRSSTMLKMNSSRKFRENIIDSFSFDGDDNQRPNAYNQNMQCSVFDCRKLDCHFQLESTKMATHSTLARMKGKKTLSQKWRKRNVRMTLYKIKSSFNQTTVQHYLILKNVWIILNRRLSIFWKVGSLISDHGTLFYIPFNLFAFQILKY